MDALSVRFNLSRRGIDIGSIVCPVCESGVETASHLFFKCSLLRQIARKVSSWWNVDYVDANSYEEWLDWLGSLRLPAKLKLMLEGVFYVVWLYIWSHRFEKEKVLGTGRESIALYLFDYDCASSAMCLIVSFLCGGITLMFWTECVVIATFLINKLPSSVLNEKYPFSLIYGREPNLSHLRSFECLCFANVVKGSDKFSHRSEKCVLIGYASGKKAYKLSSLENRNVLYSKDVKFYETVFPYKMNKNKSVNESENINFFDHFEVELETKTSNLSPNDDEEGSSDRDGRVQQLVTDANTDQLEDGETHHATPLDENNISKGNVGTSEEIVTIMGEFGIDNVVPVELLCDNKYAIQITANPEMHEKTKHFDIDVHLVREKVASGFIKNVMVDTKSQELASRLKMCCTPILSARVVSIGAFFESPRWEGFRFRVQFFKIYFSRGTIHQSYCLLITIHQKLLFISKKLLFFELLFAGVLFMESGGSDRDTKDALSKLLKMGIVAEYQNEFKMLINRVTGISESLLKFFYISELKLALQIELLRARPTTLGETFSLARITKDHFEDERSTTSIAKPNDLNTWVYV
nr:ribonuclease H-like domain-containing protein [Tanacetum cinerariifolium]